MCLVLYIIVLDIDLKKKKKRFPQWLPQCQKEALRPTMSKYPHWVICLCDNPFRYHHSAHDDNSKHHLQEVPA